MTCNVKKKTWPLGGFTGSKRVLFIWDDECECECVCAWTGARVCVNVCTGCMQVHVCMSECVCMCVREFSRTSLLDTQRTSNLSMGEKAASPCPGARTAGTRGGGGLGGWGRGGRVMALHFHARTSSERARRDGELSLNLPPQCQRVAERQGVPESGRASGSAREWQSARECQRVAERQGVPERQRVPECQGAPESGREAGRTREWQSAREVETLEHT